MNTEINELEVNGIKYVRKDSVSEKAEELDGMKYCVIRSYGAGVFCGYVKEQKADVNGVNVVLINSQRIQPWAGSNFTGLSSTLSIYDTSTLSSSPIDKKEQERRQELIKKIDEIQRQFEEAERLAYIGLSKEEIEEMYRKAVEVLNGAMITCSSSVIN